MNYTKEEHDKEIDTTDCGCVIFERTDLLFNNKKVLIQYCPKHAAAPELYEALKEQQDKLSKMVMSLYMRATSLPSVEYPKMKDIYTELDDITRLDSVNKALTQASADKEPTIDANKNKTIDWIVNAKCSKCGHEFECSPGTLNSTCYLGDASFYYLQEAFLPECPKCGNFRKNKLINDDGSLSSINGI